MRIKNSFILSLLVSGTMLITSTCLHADDLKISNSSKNQLSFKVGKVCSKEISQVEAASISIIPEKNLYQVCAKNSRHCEIKVYDAPDCKGKYVATLTLNLKEGLRVLDASNSKNLNLKVGINGFNFFVNGW